ncbi:uncharacterized protein BDR25DRAFT_350976 [Lindgomyces ingoldianus]|uniref:Uncharacterized protein n=1 Tax=Lindgomyces ingoldianus TaxID=673940 RepID=A0ACB6R945_9PLEO|nr:uncharacterized protein BDR25DRAFT_350976 [Lindgomyces ingoldianus]KAF2475607.1 hypothetical protein BDR25DRAFT_350976 [Lindgomyces ingoldianus]
MMDTKIAGELAKVKIMAIEQNKVGWGAQLIADKMSNGHMAQPPAAPQPIFPKERLGIAFEPNSNTIFRRRSARCLSRKRADKMKHEATGLSKWPRHLTAGEELTSKVAGRSTLRALKNSAIDPRPMTSENRPLGRPSLKRHYNCRRNTRIAAGVLETIRKRLEVSLTTDRRVDIPFAHPGCHH